MPTAPKVVDLTKPRDAASVMGKLVSLGLLVADPALFQKCVDRFRLAGSDPIGCLLQIALPRRREPREGTMTFPDLTTRQRKLKTHRPFFSACSQTMTTERCRCHLRHLPTYSRRRAEKLRC